MKKQYERWAILWPSINRRENERNLLGGDPQTQMTRLYLTRAEARADPDLKRFNDM